MLVCVSVCASVCVSVCVLLLLSHVFILCFKLKAKIYQYSNTITIDRLSVFLHKSILAFVLLILISCQKKKKKRGAFSLQSPIDSPAQPAFLLSCFRDVCSNPFTGSEVRTMVTHVVSGN